MKKLLIAQTVLFFITIQLVAAQPALDSAKVLLMRQEYGRAEKLVSDFLVTHQDHREALFMRFSIQQTSNLDYESYNQGFSRFLSQTDGAIAVLELRTKTNQATQDPLDFVYWGNMLGGKSVIKAKCNDWFGAINDAVRSVDLLKNAVKIDSTCFEAWYGLGLADYYLSQQLKWLPMFGNRQAEGIIEIKKSLLSPFPYNNAARNSLCWIYIERGDLKLAEGLMNEVLREYPDNTIFIRIGCRIAQLRGDVEQGRHFGELLVARSSNRNPVNWSDLMMGHRTIAMAYAAAKNSAQCKAAIDRALALKIPAGARNQQLVKMHREFMLRLRAKC